MVTKMFTEDIEESIGIFAGSLSLLLMIFWLSVTSYRLYKSRNTRKFYLHTYVDYSHIRSEILYALQTVRNRDICLLILIIMEIIIIISLSFILPVASTHLFDSVASGVSQYNETFPKCANKFESISIVLYSYTHPLNAAVYVSMCMLIISQLMLISFLNSYLAARYFKHKLQKKFFIKYFLLWVFQFLILAITVTPQIQLFLLLTMPILLAANWVNLIYTSRKLCNYIKSKIKEIRLFESNPAALREHTTNLKQYRIAMGFLISSYFFFVLAITDISTLLFIDIIFGGSCFVEQVYGIKLDIPFTGTQHAHHIHLILYFIGDISSFFFAIFYAALLIIPSLYLVVKYLVCWLYNCCTGRGNMSRMNNALFKPLVYNPY